MEKYTQGLRKSTVSLIKWLIAAAGITGYALITQISSARLIENFPLIESAPEWMVMLRANMSAILGGVGMATVGAGGIRYIYLKKKENQKEEHLTNEKVNTIQLEKSKEFGKSKKNEVTLEEMRKIRKEFNKEEIEKKHLNYKEK